MDNLSIYELVRSVPEKAQKKITGGNLNGFTDINPMWRIKMLTEIFGPCGIGWYYTIDSQWTETAADGRTAAFCNITLYVKSDGEWSKGIPGTGGSMFVDLAKEKQKASDECYKMAQTDAFSVACKLLGIGADVYWDKDKTKYSNDGNPSGSSKPSPQANSQLYACEECGSVFAPGTFNGVKFSAKEAYDEALKRRGAHICGACFKKREVSNES